MKRTYVTLPELPAPRPSGESVAVGIIGCGNFAYSNIAFYLTRAHGAVVRGCMDVDLARAASLCSDFKAGYYTDSAERILDDPAIRLVYIASNHSTHAEYAIKALSRGMSVHIEKPHVVTRAQLTRLCRAIVNSAGSVGLGFNRPLSRLGSILQTEIQSEASPMVMNWFVAGHELPGDHWYFRQEEGGRVLGNLCHWTDFILRMVPRERRYPIKIIPARGEKSDCNIAVSFVFGDGSVGVITFSAMGHTFEGVRERFSVHCGNVIAHLDDFEELIIERVAEKRVIRGGQRDHGHAAAILGSYDAAFGSGSQLNRCDVQYVYESGDLFLSTKEALDRNESVVVSQYSPQFLEDANVETRA